MALLEKLLKSKRNYPNCLPTVAAPKLYFLSNLKHFSLTFSAFRALGMCDAMRCFARFTVLVRCKLSVSIIIPSITISFFDFDNGTMSIFQEANKFHPLVFAIHKHNIFYAQRKENSVFILPFTCGTNHKKC